VAPTRQLKISSACRLRDRGSLCLYHPVVTAAALVKEFAADRNAFREKYQDDPIIILGEIKKKTTLAGGPILITLFYGDYHSRQTTQRAYPLSTA
jgi:hypothetical protein